MLCWIGFAGLLGQSACQGDHPGQSSTNPESQESDGKSTGSDDGDGESGTGSDVQTSVPDDTLSENDNETSENSSDGDDDGSSGEDDEGSSGDGSSSSDTPTESGEDSGTGSGEDSSSGDDTPDDGHDYGREVLSWVPPYGVDGCLENLDQDFGEFSPKNVLTALALQFWRPTDQGELVYEAGISDETVEAFKKKCDEHGIKLMLCVYNNNQQDPGWDWPSAQAAFRDRPEEFAESLVQSATKLGLSGVDIDFEGYSSYDDDREAFAKFLKILGEKLHGEGMLLTVDTFHSPCFNAPNMAWWKDWAGVVDHVHSMGYGTLYEGNDESFENCPADASAANAKVFKFSYQSQYGLDAGFAPGVVSVGLPDRDAWGGRDLGEHLQDILNIESPTSIAFWDFALRSSAWQDSANWKLAKQIRDTK